MSETLDLYLEKLIAKMNLDEEQRLEVEKEIRSHLEEAIQKRIDAGFLYEDAEREALLNFGQPSVLARQFGVLSGQGWFVFERLALALSLFAVPMFAAYFRLGEFLIEGLPWFLPGLLYGTLLAVPVISTLWIYLEVNGSLRIHQPIKKDLIIPFESVNSIEFQKGHLIGRRKISIKWDDQEIMIGPKLRNFRCAALALQALCSDVMDSAVKDYLCSVAKAKVKADTVFKRSLLTFGWVAIIAFLVPYYPGYWDLRDVNYWFTPMFISPVVMASLQGYFQSSRHKKGSLWVIAAFFFAAFSLIGLGVLVGHIVLIRWMLVALAFLALASTVTIWWAWSKGVLLAFNFICILLGVMAGKWVPSIWEGRISSIIEGGAMILEFTQVNDSEIEVAAVSTYEWISEEQNPDTLYGVLLIRDASGESRRFDLEQAGKWTLLGKPGGNHIGLAKWNEDKADHPSVTSGIYIYSATGLIQAIEPIEPRIAAGGHPLFGNNSKVWSPDAKRILADQYIFDETGDYTSRISSLRLEDESLTSFDVELGVSVHWMDDRHLVGWERVDPFERKESLAVLRKWSLNVNSGTSQMVREIVLPEGVTPGLVTPKDLVPIYLESPESFAVLPVDQIENFDYSSLPKIPAPGGESGPSLDFSSSPTTQRFAYFTEDHLIVADATRFQRRLPIEGGDIFFGYALSPDGQKVAFWDSNGFFQYLKVWNIDETEGITLFVSSFIGGGVAGLFNRLKRDDEGVLQWTPDSRSLLFPHGNQLLQADYEDWRESVAADTPSTANANASSSS
jgi:hypothetical protein